jgi:hypothetical protein
MQDEYSYLLKNSTWDLVHIPKGRRYFYDAHGILYWGIDMEDQYHSLLKISLGTWLLYQMLQNLSMIRTYIDPSIQHCRQV